jgi:hypothetical protein
MKRDKIFYWIATSLVALSGLIAGIMYFAFPPIVEEFKKVGYPDYLRPELGTAQLLGAIALILPKVSSRLKDWAYAGFAITFISAGIAHIGVQGASAAIAPVVESLLLVISYVYYTKLNKSKVVADF